MGRATKTSWWALVGIGLAVGCGPEAPRGPQDGGIDGGFHATVGTPCTADDACASGACVDGVCCESACTDGCSACAAALTGGTDGQCLPVVNGLDPHDACGASDCAPGTCDGIGGCALHGTSTVCRAAVDACDAAETCDGASPTCPVDALATAGTSCRAAVGACDVAEVCDGSSSACPVDGVATAGTVCRASAGACDVAEACDGVGTGCASDAVQPAGTSCRAAANTCDLADSCDGATADCADVFRAGVYGYCGVYTCSTTAPACLTSCTTVADCLPYPGMECFEGVCSTGRRIFTTSTVHDGNFGGLAGADAYCQQRATTAGLSGTFKAWLSNGTTSAAARLEHFDGPYYRVLNGAKEVVATSWADLTDGTLARTVGTTEYGMVRDSALGTRAWTGTTQFGTTGPTHCLGFTSNASTEFGTYGNTGALNGTWSDESGAGPCNAQRFLYCVEQSPPG